MENMAFVKSFAKHLIKKCSDGTYSIYGWEFYFERNVEIATYFPARNEVRPTHGYFAPHPHGNRLMARCRKFGVTFNNN